MSLDCFLKSVETMDKSSSISKSKELFSDTYFIANQIGTGAFGKIYNISSKTDPIQKYAAKVVPLPKSFLEKETDLDKETQILQTLVQEPGFPKVIDHLIEANNEILVMSLLGDNLAHLHRQCGSKFSLKTILLLALQILKRIEALHSHGMLHRDLKPENLVIGASKSDETMIYLIDFGLSTPYLDAQNKHVAFNKKGKVSGTLYYLSVFGHLGIQASRRDDLISFGYLLIHLFKGGLPWIDLPGDLHEKVKKMYQMKSTMSYETLCDGLPKEFCEYFRYVLNMPFFQNPNYSFMEDLFKKMLEEIGAKEDGFFDWMKVENKGIDLNGRKIMKESLNSYMKKMDSDTFVDMDLC